MNNRKSEHLKSGNLQSVSVIICAKNEKENLQKNLPFILQQDYPDFEIIIVDDCSDERLTMNPETSSGQANQRLRILNLTKDKKIGQGKKYALQKGIEHAKNKLILLTDADCKPMSKNWISAMAGCINDKHKIVLGISPYKKENSLLNGLIEYETTQTAMQYIGFAILGNPYMSVGRNVLYDAELLKTKNWSAEELSIASGDDDLAIQTLATKENTSVCLSDDGYTISEPKKFWKDWMKQKLRHYESGKLYKLSHRLMLGSYLFSKLLMFGAVWYYLLSSEYNELSTVRFEYLCCFNLFYMFMTISINFLLHKKLKINNRWYFSFLNDILYCIFTITLGVISQLKPVKNWK